MTSSIVPYVYDFVVRCDKKGCTAAATVCISASTYRERQHAEMKAEASLEAEGWTTWVGTRTSRRNYCPTHKPDPRSSMRQVS